MSNSHKGRYRARVLFPATADAFPITTELQKGKYWGKAIGSFSPNSENPWEKAIAFSHIKKKAEGTQQLRRVEKITQGGDRPLENRL